jgi:hypothetical protein
MNNLNIEDFFNEDLTSGKNKKIDNYSKISTYGIENKINFDIYAIEKNFLKNQLEKYKLNRCNKNIYLNKNPYANELIQYDIL